MQPLKLLLVHDAPAGVRFERHRQGAGHVSEARGPPKLAVDLSMSASEVHASVRRATRSGLLQDNDRHAPNRKALLEFLVHGLKYVFPAEHGGLTRGHIDGMSPRPPGQVSASAVARSRASGIPR